MMPFSPTGMNSFFNFNNVGNAMMMLGVSATGDNWDTYLVDSEVQAPFCAPAACAAPASAVAAAAAAAALTGAAACEAAGYEWSSGTCGTRETRSAWLLRSPPLPSAPRRGGGPRVRRCARCPTAP